VVQLIDNTTPTYLLLCRRSRRVRKATEKKQVGEEVEVKKKVKNSQRRK